MLGSLESIARHVEECAARRRRRLLAARPHLPRPTQAEIDQFHDAWDQLDVLWEEEMYEYLGGDPAAGPLLDDAMAGSDAAGDTLGGEVSLMDQFSSTAPDRKRRRVGMVHRDTAAYRSAWRRS